MFQNGEKVEPHLLFQFPVSTILIVFGHVKEKEREKGQDREGIEREREKINTNAPDLISKYIYQLGGGARSHFSSGPRGVS